MKSSAKKVELASVDDVFSTEESRADAQRERVLEIPLSELHPFKNHPFKVKDDEAMLETADSIRQYGVLVPAIARPDPEGGYELVAGHRRHRASELAEKLRHSLREMTCWTNRPFPSAPTGAEKVNKTADCHNSFYRIVAFFIP